MLSGKFVQTMVRETGKSEEFFYSKYIRRRCISTSEIPHTTAGNLAGIVKFRAHTAKTQLPPQDGDYNYRK